MVKEKIASTGGVEAYLEAQTREWANSKRPSLAFKQPTRSIQRCCVRY
jgi:hypothetical protein